MDVLEILKSVQWAKRLFYDYNNKIESIISQIKECFEKYNSQGEAKNVSSLFDENGIRYSIMTRDVERHLTILRVDYTDDVSISPYLFYLFYYNNNPTHTDDWEGWIYSNTEIIESFQKERKAKIIDSSNPSSKDTLFGYYPVSVAELLNQRDIKIKTEESVNWFEQEIYNKFNKQIEFKKS